MFMVLFEESQKIKLKSKLLLKLGKNKNALRSIFRWNLKLLFQKSI